MTGLMPTITSHRALTPERFWIPVQTFAADGGTRPKLRGRSVSSALSCISFHIRAEGTAGTFQRGKFPNQQSNPETPFLKAPLPFRAHNRTKSRNTQQAWIYSRNRTTITSPRKHRQPVILHPSDGSRGSESS